MNQRVASLAQRPPPGVSARSRPVTPSAWLDDSAFKWVLAVTFVMLLNFAIRQQWVEYGAFFVASIVGIGSCLFGAGRNRFGAIPPAACVLVAVLTAYAAGGLVAKYGSGGATSDNRIDPMVSAALANDKAESAVPGAHIVDAGEPRSRLIEAVATWAHKDAKPKAEPVDCQHVVDSLEPHYAQCRLHFHSGQ